MSQTNKSEYESKDTRANSKESMKQNNVQNEKKTMPQVQPIVIDQILTVGELDLKSFIGVNKNDPIVSSIGKSLEKKTKVPKMAANVFEARKLMKVRRKIEMTHQKKIGTKLVILEIYIQFSMF